MILERPRPKALIFDLFHTLSSLHHASSPGPNTHELLGLGKEEWNNALFHLSEDRLKGHITDPFQIIKSVTDQINPDIPSNIIARAAKKRAERFIHSFKYTQPEILLALEKIKSTGIKMALCSNADVMERAGWEGSSLEPFFFTAVFSCDVNLMKPEKEIYLLTAKRLGVKPEDCFFIGDGGSHEFEGAREAGMTVVFTSQLLKDLWPEKIPEREKQADFHISKLEEILPFCPNTD